jgi:NADH-quinone oxidoreductase subunit H
MRSAAQIVAYEIAMGFALVGVLMAGGSLNLGEIVRAQEGGFCTGSGCRCCRCSSSTSSRAWPRPTARPSTSPRANRRSSPASTSSIRAWRFAVFFLAEYANMILIAALASVFFLGGWLSPFEGAFPCSAALLLRGAQLLLAGPQDLVFPVLLPVVPGDLPALPLRPDHAAGLEGVHSGHIIWMFVEGLMVWFKRRPVVRTDVRACATSRPVPVGAPGKGCG